MRLPRSALVSLLAAAAAAAIALLPSPASCAINITKLVEALGTPGPALGSADTGPLQQQQQQQRATREEADALRSQFLPLLQVLLDQKVLPVDKWGYGRPAPWQRSRYAGPFDRWAIDTVFAGLVKDNTSDTYFPEGTKCLEWDINYSHDLPCGQRWTMTYASGLGSVDLSAKHISGDLNSFSDDRVNEIFDFVVCTQVFEHIHKPQLAANGLARLTKPGGYVFISVPFMQRYHLYPHDLYRYTIDGAIHIFENAGFKIHKAYIVGNLYTTLAMYLGYGTLDASEELLQATLYDVTDWRKSGAGRPETDLHEDFYLGNILVLQKL